MTTWIQLGLGTFLTVTLLATANPVAAQSGWPSDADDAQSQTTSPEHSGRSRASHDDSIRGYDEFKGFYAQFGITIGGIDYDGPSDIDAGGGVSMTGGYRILPWLSAEANFTYVGGADAEFRNNNSGEANYFAFTVGPKFYPMAAFDQEIIPEFIQPYGLLAIGGGEFEIDGIRGSRGHKKSSFITRFIFGVDFWITDHVGTYVEGGYHAAADDDIDGTGVFTFGGQYRF